MEFLEAHGKCGAAENDQALLYRQRHPSTTHTLYSGLWRVLVLCWDELEAVTTKTLLFSYKIWNCLKNNMKTTLQLHLDTICFTCWKTTYAIFNVYFFFFIWGLKNKVRCGKINSQRSEFPLCCALLLSCALLKKDSQTPSTQGHSRSKRMNVLLLSVAPSPFSLPDVSWIPSHCVDTTATVH